MANQAIKKVAGYYTNFESFFGYDLVLNGVKHFGYYPEDKSAISEQKAQELMQDLIIEKIHLSKNDVVLDAGCGQGHVATYLAKKIGCKVVGITVTPFEVRKAKMLARKKSVMDLTSFYESDYSSAGFVDNYFSAIYTMETLVHAYNLRKTLKEFYRILKPKGKAVFFEYSLAKEKKFTTFDSKYNFQFKALTEWVIKKSAMMGLEKLSYGTLADLVRETGFQHIYEQNITANIYPSFAKLYRLAKYPYLLFKLLGLQNLFINTKVAAEWFPILLNYQEEDLFRYTVISAEKA